LWAAWRADRKADPRVVQMAAWKAGLLDVLKVVC
jgi:hypothetical protein